MNEEYPRMPIVEGWPDSLNECSGKLNDLADAFRQFARLSAAGCFNENDYRLFIAPLCIALDGAFADLHKLPEEERGPIEELVRMYEDAVIVDALYYAVTLWEEHGIEIEPDPKPEPVELDGGINGYNCYLCNIKEHRPALSEKINAILAVMQPDLLKQAAEA